MSSELHVTIGLLRSLYRPGSVGKNTKDNDDNDDGGRIEFLRYLAYDPYLTPRCKAVSVQYLLQQAERRLTEQQEQEDDDDDDDRPNKKQPPSSSVHLLDRQVRVAKICFGGLPPYADAPAPGCGLDACDALILRPDLSAVRVPLPYAPRTALVLCDLREPPGASAKQSTKGPQRGPSSSSTSSSDLCCRTLLRNVVRRARKEFGLSFTVGAELEFHLIHIDSNHVDLKSNPPKTVLKPVDFTTFAGTTGLNRYEDFATDVARQLRAQRIGVEQVHCESAHGQFEVVLERCAGDPVRMADHIVLAQETVRHVAYQHRLKAIFLPKPYPDMAGNGCHYHISATTTAIDNTQHKNIINAFAGTEDTVSSGAAMADRDVLSPAGQSFVQGVLDHLPSLLAVTAPTANSFRRIGPGCWTGSEIAWSIDDKEAPVRVVLSEDRHYCRGGGGGGGIVYAADRVEYKLNDSASNPYLGLACVLSCGVDGVRRRAPLCPSRSELLARRGRRPPPEDDAPPFLPELPRTPQESLDCLEQDGVLVAGPDPVIPPVLGRAYLAVRRDESDRHTNRMTYDEIVQEAIDKA